MRLFVSTGLRAAPDAPLRGHLAILDPDGGVERIVPFPGDPATVPGPLAHQELTCAALDRDGLVVQPTHTELLWIDPATLAVVRRVSHPLFHNVHSAAVHPVDGRIALTCAGIESVLELSPSGALLAHHFLRGGSFAEAYPGVSDFRLADHDAFKPHSHHPNHACWVGDELWVTRFETKDAVSIPHGRRVALGGVPHDGRLRAGRAWFTRITGQVVVVDPASATLERTIDLAAAAGPLALGWCRGVEVAEGRLFVGFSMLRSTWHREVLRHLIYGAAGEKRPTRVVEADPATGAVLREWILGGAAGGTVYGVLAVP
jgi:hypothetical protein